MRIISFVIPCYGSEKTIGYVINEIEQKLLSVNEYDYEIICVNDNSPDDVLNVLKSIAQDNNSIKVIDLAKNSGKHAAVMAGYKYVTGDVVVNLDDDGQCPIDKLWQLIDALGDDCDIAIAKYPKKKQSGIKNIGSKINAIMTAVMIDKPKHLQLSNFSVLKRYVVDEVLKYDNPYPYIDGLFLRTTKKIKNVEMEERDRISGESNFTIKKSLSLWINGLTAFSVKPLRVSSLIGVVCALIGFVFGAITIIRKIVLPYISVGWSSTVSIMLFIGGLIMLMLGMIGEYIGRIYISLNNSPQYVIRETINIDK